MILMVRNFSVLAKGSRDPVQLRRLLALAEIYDGGARKRCGADRRGSAGSAFRVFVTGGFVSTPVGLKL
jgi:hypothetical protein